jgi:hypothetical protein
MSPAPATPKSKRIEAVMDVLSESIWLSVDRAGQNAIAAMAHAIPAVVVIDIMVPFL